jgi:hypothetical protein
LYVSPNIFRVIISKRIRGARCVALMRGYKKFIQNFGREI